MLIAACTGCAQDISRESMSPCVQAWSEWASSWAVCTAAWHDVPWSESAVQLQCHGVSCRTLTSCTAEEWYESYLGNQQRYDPVMPCLLKFSKFILNFIHLFHITPCGPGYPLSCLFPPLSIHFLIFCSVYYFPFSFYGSLYLFSSFVHPFPFYQNSHHSVSRPEIVGGDWTWV